jgi:cytoskeletal protein CcmA (bactofilin family)
VVTAKRPLLIAGRQVTVEGSVQTAELAIYGQVTGTIGTRRLRVENGASVEGEIFHRTLDVKPQSQLQATIHRLPAAGE